MKTARLEYRCRRCGQVYRLSYCDEPTAISLVCAAEPPTPYLHAECPDNGVGIGDLIGYRIEAEADSEPPPY